MCTVFPELGIWKPVIINKINSTVDEARANALVNRIGYIVNKK